MGTAQGWRAIADDHIRGAGPIEQDKTSCCQLAVSSSLTHLKLGFAESS
jgi:hypothetical protein